MTRRMRHEHFQSPVHRVSQCNRVNGWKRVREYLTFSPLFIGSLNVTSAIRPGVHHRRHFQSPVHRVSQCNFLVDDGNKLFGVFQSPVHRVSQCNRPQTLQKNIVPTRVCTSSPFIKDGTFFEDLILAQKRKTSSKHFLNTCSFPLLIIPHSHHGKNDSFKDIRGPLPNEPIKLPSFLSIINPVSVQTVPHTFLAVS